MNRLMMVSLIIMALISAGCQDEPVPLAPAGVQFATNEMPEYIPEDPYNGRLELPADFKQKVLENCLLVQAAVERFAAENGGMYPTNLADRTPAGDTVIDMLPDGMLLVNPAYFCRTEPVNGAAAVPGQTGYMVAINAQHQPTGYLITGYGMQDEIVQIYKDPDGLPADGHHESGQRVDPAMDSGVE